MQIGGGFSSSLLSSLLQQTNNQLNQVITQLASGKSINSASDNAAGLSLVNDLQSSVNSLNTANQGINLAQGALNTASGALQSQTDQLQQLKDLAVQSANGTLNPNDRAALQQQFDQVVQSIDSISKNTSFNGVNLLDGSFNQSIQTGAAAGQSLNVAIGSTSANSLGINSIGISDQTSASNALSVIDSAIQKVDSTQSSIGASQNTLNFSSQNNQSTVENLSQAQSQAGDANLAETVSKFNQLQIQQQAQIDAEQALLKTQGNLTKLFG